MTPFQKIGRDDPPELNAPFVSPPEPGPLPDLVSTPDLGVVPERRLKDGRRKGDVHFYSPAVVSLAAYCVLGVTSVTSGAVWVFGQVVELRPEAQAVADRAGLGAVYVMVGTIATLVVNAYVADRKSSRESAERIALSEQRASDRAALLAAENARQLIEAKAAADRLIVSAKLEADAKLAAANVRIGQLGARLETLEGRGTSPGETPALEGPDATPGRLETIWGKWSREDLRPKVADPTTAAPPKP